jgi:hypothetical protein
MSFETWRDRNLQYQQSDGNGEHPVAKGLHPLQPVRPFVISISHVVIIPSRAVRRFTRVG